MEDVNKTHSAVQPRYTNRLAIEVDYHQPNQPFWVSSQLNTDLIPSNHLFAPYLKQTQKYKTDEAKLADWRREQWGTDEDPLILYSERSQNQIVLHFKSLYPPLIGIEKLSKIFPASLFTYFYQCRKLNLQVLALIKNGLSEKSRHRCFGDPARCRSCNTEFRPEMTVDGLLIDRYCFNCRISWSIKTSLKQKK
ncbi:MAG: hypothetical protein AAFQ80_07565 [Cyanobacteria bacterium J06621_8]